VSDESTNFAEDIYVPTGTTLSYIFAIEPLDLTGATAAFITDFGTYTTALAMTTDGQVTVTTFTTLITATAMAAVAVGVHTWRLLVTMADGVTILPYGNGSINVGST
jgi:fructose-1,6-bisphosphatase/inositol monophosphatase family enzyme